MWWLLLLSISSFANTINYSDVSKEPNFAPKSGIWVPENFWDEDQTYQEYQEWMKNLSPNALTDARTKMENIAACKCPTSPFKPSKPCPNTLPKVDCTMENFLKAEHWDCSSTGAYMWLRFSYEKKLPYTSGPIITSGSNGIHQFTHSDTDFSNYSDPEERFLMYAKSIQIPVYVQDLNDRLTYPIQLKYLQGGTINLSYNHTRIISGFDLSNPFYITGQWEYTTLREPAVAFEDLRPYVQSPNKYGFRLYRLPYFDKQLKSWQLKKPSDHKRYDFKNEQYQSREDFLESISRAKGISLSPTMRITASSSILEGMIARRNDYLKNHPWDHVSLEGTLNFDDASTPSNDARFITFCSDLENFSKNPHYSKMLLQHEVEATISLDTSYENLFMGVMVFCEAFKNSMPDLSNPTKSRWPSIRKVLEVLETNESLAKSSHPSILDGLITLVGEATKYKKKEAFKYLTTKVFSSREDYESFKSNILKLAPTAQYFFNNFESPEEYLTDPTCDRCADDVPSDSNEDESD